MLDSGHDAAPNTCLIFCHALLHAHILNHYPHTDLPRHSLSASISGCHADAALCIPELQVLVTTEQTCVMICQESIRRFV